MATNHIQLTFPNNGLYHTCLLSEQLSRTLDSCFIKKPPNLACTASQARLSTDITNCWRSFLWCREQGNINLLKKPFHYRTDTALTVSSAVQNLTRPSLPKRKWAEFKAANPKKKKKKSSALQNWDWKRINARNSMKSTRDLAIGFAVQMVRR